jgi:tubulin polyglutamylase TTLL6/13
MHLTNYAINKRSQEFVFNTSEERDDVGHKRSYSAVMRRIKEMGYDTGKLHREVEMLLVRTLMAAEGSMVQADRECKREGDSVCF